MVSCRINKFFPACCLTLVVSSSLTAIVVVWRFRDNCFAIKWWIELWDHCWSLISDDVLLVLPITTVVFLCVAAVWCIRREVYLSLVWYIMLALLIFAISHHWVLPLDTWQILDLWLIGDTSPWGDRHVCGYLIFYKIEVLNITGLFHSQLAIIGLWIVWMVIWENWAIHTIQAFT